MTPIPRMPVVFCDPPMASITLSPRCTRHTPFMRAESLAALREDLSLKRQTALHKA